MTIYRFASLEYDKSAWDDFFMGRRDSRYSRGWVASSRPRRARATRRPKPRSFDDGRHGERIRDARRVPPRVPEVSRVRDDDATADDGGDDDVQDGDARRDDDGDSRVVRARRIGPR